MVKLQVLSSLEPLDYIVVSFLPGISEVIFLIVGFFKIAPILRQAIERNWCYFLMQGFSYIISSHKHVFQELLFRGALLPLVGVDWRGAAASGLVFGILHISGGRNVAFATW